jgi:xyloglucan:xyloglucosyl transferase
MTGRVPEYEFPAKRMSVRASLWDGSGWTTDGGRTKIDWNRAPFTAAFCANTSSSTPCGSPDLWWNARRYRRLSAEQRAAYENVKNTYMNYDYCTNKDRFKNGNAPAECSYD